MTVSLTVIFLSQVDVRDGFGFNGSFPHKRFRPVDSNALCDEVRAARSASDALREQRGPVIPAGQASSTGAATKSEFKILRLDPFAGMALRITFD